MKNLNLIKALLDLFLFFAVLGLITALILLPFFYTSSEWTLPITIKGQELDSVSTMAKVVVTLSVVGNIVFVYAIFLLRKILISFQKHQIFVDSVIRNFFRIGYLIIGYGLMSTVPPFIYNIAEQSKIGIEMNGSGFDSLTLTISLGLLFIVIGEIFKHAKMLREESDLIV